jgi:hypothetical protein
MLEESTNPGETPTNQGGGTSPQTEEPTADTQRSGETPVNQGGGS